MGINWNIVADRRKKFKVGHTSYGVENLIHTVKKFLDSTFFDHLPLSVLVKKYENGPLNNGGGGGGGGGRGRKY